MKDISEEGRIVEAEVASINSAIRNLRQLIRELPDEYTGFTPEVDTISSSIDSIQSEMRDAVRKSEQES